MNRDEVFLIVFEHYLKNNELRHDLNAGIAMRKDGYKPAVALMFDIAEQVMAEKALRDAARS